MTTRGNRSYTDNSSAYLSTPLRIQDRRRTHGDEWNHFQRDWTDENKSPSTPQSFFCDTKFTSGETHQKKNCLFTPGIVLGSREAILVCTNLYVQTGEWSPKTFDFSCVPFGSGRVLRTTYAFPHTTCLRPLEGAGRLLQHRTKC